jgi:hypothetical protein
LNFSLIKPNQRTPEDQALIDKRKDALKRCNVKAEDAYLETLEEERIKNAREKAKRDAANLANQQPFYKKLINLGGAIAKDLGNIQPNPDALINFNDEPSPRKKRSKRKRRKN